jgi:Chromo (CHRromatin Organisation MOdifier) domain
MVNGQQEWEVERIVDRHIKLNKNGPVVKYWIKWKGYSPHENTLEPVDNLGNAKDMIDKYERQHPIDIASLYRKSGKPVPPNLSRAQG